MSFLSARARKSLADVTRHKGRTLLVTLGIFIGVFGLTTLNMTEDTLVSAYAYTRGYQATQPDYQMRVAILDPQLLPALQALPNVKAVQYVSGFSAYWQRGDTRCNLGINIFSYPDEQHIPISSFQLIVGRYPGLGEIVMEQGDQRLHNVSVGDTVTMHIQQDSVTVRVVGLVRTPGANPSVSGDALAYMSDAGLQQVVTALGDPVDTTPDGVRIPVYQHHIQVTFQHAQGTPMSVAVTALQQTAQMHGVTVLDSGFAPKADPATVSTIDNIFALLRTLALLAVTLSALLILNTISVLVTEQTKIIGAMKAIGGTSATIMRDYLASVGIYALIATPPAVALGVYAGDHLATALAPQIPLELGPLMIAPWIVALSLAVGFGMPLLAALPALWNGTRITVHEAFSAHGISTRYVRKASARRGQPVTWVSQTVWLALRGLFRKRWRAALSVTTLTLTAACFLVAQITATSINATIGAVRAPLVADMTVSFHDPTTFSKVRAQLSALPNVRAIERSGSTHVSTSWGTLQVSAYESQTQIYRYQLTSGRWFTDGDTHVVLLSDAAAKKTGLKLGDTLLVTNAFGSSVQLALTVIGTLKQSIDILGWIGAAVLPVNALYELTGVAADSVASATQTITIAAIDRSLAAVNQLAARVSSVVNPAGAASDDPGYYAGSGGTVDTIHEYTTRRQGDANVLYYLLYALALVVGAIGALALANALIASVLERRREIGLLRAMGASGRRVAQVVWVESVALGGISWLAGVVLGLPLAYAFVQTFAWQVMPVDFSVEPLAFAVTLLAVLVIATVASVAPSWGISRARIAAILRYE